MVDRKRKIIQNVIDLDTKRLYGNLSEAIKYLQEIQATHPDKPDLCIDEHWFGYEDMELRFVYNAPETDTQYNERIALEMTEDKRQADIRAEEARKKKIRSEIERLRRQL